MFNLSTSAGDGLVRGLRSVGLYSYSALKPTTFCFHPLTPSSGVDHKCVLGPPRRLAVLHPADDEPPCLHPLGRGVCLHGIRLRPRLHHHSGWDPRRCGGALGMGIRVGAGRGRGQGMSSVFHMVAEAPGDHPQEEYVLGAERD